MKLIFENVSKSYGKTRALIDFSLTLEPGKVLLRVLSEEKPAQTAETATPPPDYLHFFQEESEKGGRRI